MKSALYLIAFLMSVSAFADTGDDPKANDEPLMLGEFNLASTVSYSLERNDDGEPFDPNYKQEEDAKQAVIDAVCGEVKNFFKKTECVGDVSKEFTRAGRLRGTIDFVRLNYLPLDRKALTALLTELESAYKASRDYFAGDRPAGVISRQGLNVEIIEVKNIIAITNKRELVSACEEIFGEGHSRCKLP